MIELSVYSLATGQILPQRIVCTSRTQAEANVPDGCALIDGALDPYRQRVDLTTGQVITSAPTVDMAAARAQRWEGIKAARTRRLAGTFTSGGLEFEIDQLNLPGAALDALRAQLAGEPWSQAWVLADNTVATLSATEMITAGRAMRAAISDLWAISETLRAQVEAATTPEQLASITWPTSP